MIERQAKKKDNKPTDEKKDNKEAILKGREAINKYRVAHEGLYLLGWYKRIPEDHSPLLNALIEVLEKLGFLGLSDFFDASDELNMKELGFASKDAFYKQIDKLNMRVKPRINKIGMTVIEDTPEVKRLRDKLARMWH